MSRNGEELGLWRGSPGELEDEWSEHCSQGNHLCGDQEWDLSSIMQRKEMKRGLCLGQGWCVWKKAKKYTNKCSSLQGNQSEWNTSHVLSGIQSLFSLRLKKKTKQTNMQMKMSYHRPGKINKK